MHSDLAKSGKKLAKKGLLTQCVSSLLLIVIALLLKPEHTFTVILGAVSFIVPHSFFAYWSFRYAGATKNNLVAQSFNQGMKVRFALSVIFFAVSFSLFEAPAIIFFGAYVTVMVSQALAMVVLSKQAVQ